MTGETTWSDNSLGQTVGFYQVALPVEVIPVGCLPSGAVRFTCAVAVVTAGTLLLFVQHSYPAEMGAVVCRQTVR